MTREERALKNLKQMCSDGRYLGSGSHAPLEALEDFEVAIKALEQEPRKGHWIGNYQVDFGEWQEYDVKLSDGFVADNCHCSECGEELLSGDRGMFCPCCGADMRKVVENG